MDPEMFNDHISRGITLMTAEKYDAAKEEFESAIQINRKSYEAYIHLGNACANLEQYDNAITAFKNALVIDPASGEALYSVGNVHLLQGDRQKAVEYYNKAEAAGFERAELYQILAGIFYDIGDVSQALRNISRAIAAAPLDGELRLFKARIYLAENRYNEALETLEDLQKILPDAFEAYDLRSQILCAMGRYAEALRICEDGCQRFPKDPNIALAKLKVLVAMEQDEAARLFIGQMKQDGLFDMVLKPAVIQESILAMRARNVEEAIRLLIEADAKLNGDPDLTYLILDAYGKTENYQQILPVSEALIAMDPGDFYESTARYFHAHALDKLGRDAEAKAEYRKLTSLLRHITVRTPAFYEGYIYRLLSHTRLGEFDKALELADYIENLYPERPDGHTFRYFIYKEQGDTAKAEAEKIAAQQIDPNVNL